MERSEYLANLRLATSRPSWEQPSRQPRRPTRVAPPPVRMGFVAALLWSAVLYVGIHGLPF